MPVSERELSQIKPIQICSKLGNIFSPPLLLYPIHVSSLSHPPHLGYNFVGELVERGGHCEVKDRVYKVIPFED